MTKATTMRTGELEQRLRRHYLPETEMLPGGIFVTEVGGNASYVTNRRCDAIYVGFTSASGRIMVGHELKVSRADWRHELDTLGKADHWSDACHQWIVVAPSTDIVPIEELPAGWGLMTPDPRSPRRFKTHVRGAIKERHSPPWWATRAVIARQDTLRAQAERDRIGAVMRACMGALSEQVQTGSLPARTQYYDQWREFHHLFQELARQSSPAAGGRKYGDDAIELLEAFAKAGVKLGHYSYAGDPCVTPNYLAPLAALLMANASRGMIEQQMTRRYASLADIESGARKLRELISILDTGS